MELTQLQHFLKVAECGGFTRAAEELVMSQPALSRSVARLEEELGQPLFERKPRSVVLTSAGELLEARARRIMALVEDTKAEITDDGETGRLRIGAIPTIAPYLLPSVLKDFAAAHPRCSVQVLEDVTERIVQALRLGEIDAAILALPITVPYLETVPLFDEELLLVVAKEHPLATKERPSQLDLKDEPFVLLGETHCLSDSVVSYCRRKNFQPVSVERTSQLTTVQELVALGHGISLIPEMARRLDASDRRVYRSLRGERPTRTVALATNPYRFRSRLLDAFCCRMAECRG